MPTFLHTADWQIGRQYGRFAADDAAALAEARLSVVERIARMAAEQKVDAVLVAGDVFDAQTVSERTMRRLFHGLQAYTGPWILLPGNHDAALAESVWDHAQRLQFVPANVHMALAPRVLAFAEQGFAVLPAPLTQRHTYDDLTAWFDAAETPCGLLRLGLAHGSVQGLLHEEIDSSNPIAADRAARARLDYLALGDWHGCRQIDARTWYSGTPEQDRFKDNGAGQVLRVEIAAPGAAAVVTPLATGQYRWQQWSAQLHVDSDVEALSQRLQDIADLAVVDVTLSGHVSLEGQNRIHEALAKAEARCRSVQCDMSALRLQPNEDEIAALHADGYLGDTLRALRERQQGAGEDAAMVREALGILAALLRERESGVSSQGDAA